MSQLEIFQSLPLRARWVDRLGVARLVEEKAWADLVNFTAATLERAWVCSVHHAWLEEIQEIIEGEVSGWWRYKTRADYLRSLLRKGSLYASENQDVLDVAERLEAYSDARHDLVDKETERFRMVNFSPIERRAS